MFAKVSRQIIELVFTASNNVNFSHPKIKHPKLLLNCFFVVPLFFPSLLLSFHLHNRQIDMGRILFFFLTMLESFKLNIKKNVSCFIQCQCDHFHLTIKLIHVQCRKSAHFYFRTKSNTFHFLFVKF